MICTQVRYLGNPLFICKDDCYIYSVENNKLVKYKHLLYSEICENIQSIQLLEYNDGISAIFHERFIYILTNSKIIAYSVPSQIVFVIKLTNFSIFNESRIIFIEHLIVQIQSFKDVYQINFTTGEVIQVQKVWPIKISENIFARIENRQLSVYLPQFNIIEVHNVDMQQILSIVDNLILFKNQNIVYSYNLLNKQTRLLQIDERLCIIYQQYLLFYNQKQIQFCELQHITNIQQSSYTNQELQLLDFYKRQLLRNRISYIQMYQSLNDRKQLFAHLLNSALNYFDGLISLNQIEKFLFSHFTDLIDDLIRNKESQSVKMQLTLKNIILSADNFIIIQLLTYDQDVFIICEQYGQYFFTQL